MSEYSIQVTCLDNLEKHERLPAGALVMLRVSVERDRVASVLDGWADKPNRARSWEVLKRDDGWDCMLHSGTGKTLFAGVQSTPDAARAAAARAIEAGEV